MVRNLALICLGALLLAPANSHADGDKKPQNKTVRLVIECSPKTADAIQHLLKGLPAKVYRAEPVHVRGGLSKPRTTRIEAQPIDPKTLPMPTGVVSVVPAWNAIDAAVQATGKGYIDKLTITPRSARVTIVAQDETALQELRRALESSAVLKKRAKNPRHIVEPGAVVRVGDRIRGDLTVSFGETPSDPDGRVDAPSIAESGMITMAITQANLRTQRAGREYRDKNRATRTVRIGREWVFDETSLTNLRAFVASLERTRGAVPTEVRWKLRDPKHRGDDQTLIQKPSVKIEQWTVIGR